MKAITMLMLSLALVGSTFAAQDTTKTSSKQKSEKAATVDCSAATDDSITASVKEKLSKTPSLKSANIEVATNEGAVMLKGVVKTSGLKGVATRMTKRVACVKKVENQLSVEQPSKPGAKKSSSDD
jgi:osmotically-inducible protein OsmY